MPDPIKRRLISHSEVDTLGQCEYKHYYAHELKLESISHSDNLQLGNTGHAFMQVFLTGIKEGLTDEQAKQKATHHIISMPRAARALEICYDWIRLIWPTLDWKIVAVEIEYRVVITETLVYPMKADVLVETEGKLAVVDHKFIYDFYPKEVIEIMPQLPRYIAGMRNQGIKVDFAIYNMMRTRIVVDEEKKFSLKPTYPSNTRVIQSFKEQIEGMQRIENGIPFRVRTATKVNCANCQFAELCTMDLNGEDSTLYKEVFFKPNTYGYKDTDEES